MTKVVEEVEVVAKGKWRFAVSHTYHSCESLLVAVVAVDDATAKI